MRRKIKDLFLDIAEEWDTYWKENVSFYDFINEYVEINDDLRSYVVKRKKQRVEE